MLKRITIVLSTAAAILSAVGTGMALAQEAEPRFMFRYRSGLLPMQIASVPEDEDDDEEAPPTPAAFHLDNIHFTPLAFSVLDATGDGRIGVGDRFEWHLTAQNRTGFVVDSTTFSLDAAGLSMRVNCPGMEDGASSFCAGSETIVSAAICGVPSEQRDREVYSDLRIGLTRAVSDGRTHRYTGLPRYETPLMGTLYVVTGDGANCAT